uniref:Thioredoxin domain-containing protein n=1 Tax=Euplotes harpa TaxID=151035 RepID=A0A7S3J4G6_9SPIT|mmetsp:Transcript_16655/g.19269  ORF Transcript_16655/g.19269 Transcript_16655/m.19269 type:complete len:353 (+) Transcript_16655:789-1847(+)
MGAKWFNGTSTNSIVLFSNVRPPSDLQRMYDLEVKDNYDLTRWINFSSLEEVEEFTPLSYYIMKHFDMPIFIAFFDQNYTQHQECKSLMSKLEIIAHEYPQILFSYTDDSRLYHLKDKVFINWDEMPAFGLVNNEDMMPIVFPRNQPFTNPNLHAFLDGFMKGTIYNRNFTLPDVNLNFSSNMEKVYKLSSFNATEMTILLDDSQDGVLLLYNSSDSFTINNQVTQIFEMTAELFARLEANTLKFFQFDVANAGIHESLVNEKPFPQAQFLPAFHKNITPYKVIPELGMHDLIEYVKKHSEISLDMVFKRMNKEILNSEEILEDEHNDFDEHSEEHELEDDQNSNDSSVEDL